MRLIIIVATLTLVSPAVWAEGPAYDDTLSGKKCSESDQQLNCEYKVGRDLEFSIAGIGVPDTSITFTRTMGLEGEYYASFGLMHGCIIIKHGKNSNLFFKDFAFVSPKNGKVYRTSDSSKLAF